MSGIYLGSHWCRNCKKAVTLRTRTTLCPNCGGVNVLRQLDNNATTTITTELNQRPIFMEAVSNFLRRQTSVRNSTGTSDPLNGNSWDSYLIFSGEMPSHLPRNGGHVDFLNETLGFRREIGGDYFIGPGVEEFFEHATRNNLCVPPPASRSSIDSLPVIKISRKHVRADSTCAVCKERFESGSRVCKLPCNHLYHKDCIVPWLEQHGTCPVCREQINSRKFSTGWRNDQNSRERNKMRKKKWSYLWPFGSARSNSDKTVVFGPGSFR